nr:retrovirus-related Pol polyprotein from transposon TNT 1-94 [Tanacetum cinerariifolium]GEV51991.1 retrovirus-related Pol polyprotein from transposon TNT 1-94 [Tanacetum cinerariifolium]
MKVKEFLNVTFDETPPPPKTLPLEDDDLIEEQAIKQTALAISNTEAEYVSAGKACQQALWMKQALVDYGISRKDKDKDEDPSAGSDRGLKKMKTNKDAEPTKCLKTKESTSGSSKSAKSQSKSSGKSVQSKEPEFEVADSDMPHAQEDSLGNDDEEPNRKVASKRGWFTKPKQPKDPTDPDWNVGKTPQQGPTQIYLKITNLTQETPLGPAFKLLKGTRTNYVELEYDFKECYKALLEKLDWDNPKGDDYPFDLTKPLPLVMNGNHQMVPVDYFFNNNLKYLQGGISTMTYTTFITKTKATQYDLLGIKDKTIYGYARGLESTHDVYSTKRILAVTRVEVMRKHGYGYLREIEVQRADNDLYTFKEGDFLRLHINDIEDMLIHIVQNRLTNLLGDDVFDFSITLRMLMRSDELYKFNDGTLTRLRTSLDEITKNIQMEYLPQRRWSSLEKKRAHTMIKAIDKQLKERRMMKSFEKFVGGRYYGTDLRLLQRTV